MNRLDVGLMGHGKSYISAEISQKLLRRNIKWYKKAVKRYNNNVKYKGIAWAKINEAPKRRMVWLDLKISDEWLNNLRHAYAKEFIRYWDNPIDLATAAEHCDVVWDEIARHLDSRNWDDVHPEVKAFLQEADKRGVDIYANTQFPMQVDVMYRRSCEQMWLITKKFGSKRPDLTKPPVRFVWGLIVLSPIARISFNDEIEEMIFEEPFFAIFKVWNWRWINSKITSFYDTKWRIEHKWMPYVHVERKCEDPKCGYKHTKHI